MSYLRRPIILAVMTAILLRVGNMPGSARAANEVSPLNQALGAGFLAKAELALLKGQLNTGKVYIAAAHEADPGISAFRLKTLDMIHKDFPYRQQGLPGYLPYKAIACSMDDRFLVYTTARGVTRLDLETNEVKSIVRDDLGMSLNIVLSPNGRFAAGCYNDGKLTLCDMELGKVVGEYSFRREQPPSLTTVKMSFSPDEKLLAACYEYSDDDKRGIHFLSTKDLSIVKTMSGHGRILKFLGDGSLLLGMNDRCLLVDPATLQPIKTLAPATGWDADYLPCENLLAIGGSGRITVFNTATQEKLAEYQAASHNIVMVRFLAAGRYIVYASPKRESGVIDCTSGKPLQVFEIGREAAVSPSRYLLFADGKVIDLSACQPYEANLSAEIPHTTRPSRSTIPEGVMKTLTDTSEKALSQSGGSIRLAAKNTSGVLEAYGTSDGRTFIYDRTRKEVNLLLTDHYRLAIDFTFFPDNSHFVRLCTSGNGMAGAVEIYSLPDGKRSTLRLDDPPVSVAIAPDIGVGAILDRKNRVYLVNLPTLDAKVELLPAVLSKRQLFVDQETKTLVVKTDNDTVAYDLRKVAEDRTLPTYAEASSRYSVSLDESDLQFDRPERVERRKAEPLAPTTTGFDVPEENLRIPEEMQTCAANLHKIYAAIKEYEKDKGKLPDWLSDLVPDYLSSEQLFCPSDGSHKSAFPPDPKLPCSYGWQFSAKPIPTTWDATGRTLYRDWKTQQVKFFGDVVPMVRCYHHDSKRVLNLSVGGKIWWGPQIWEPMFRPDYASIHKQMLSSTPLTRSSAP